MPCCHSQGLFKLSVGIEDEPGRPNPDRKLPHRNHHRMEEMEPQRSPHRLQQPLWTVLLFEKSPRLGAENPRPRRVLDLVPDLLVSTLPNWSERLRFVAMSFPVMGIHQVQSTLNHFSAKDLASLPVETIDDYLLFYFILLTTG